MIAIRVVLAIDIGGTSTRLVISDLEGLEIARRIIPTRPRSYLLALRDMIQAAKSLAEGRELVGVGVGVAATVESGKLIGSANLPGWIGSDLQTDLWATLNVPVIVYNDAQAAGLGEFTAQNQPIIYVIWGTGVGVSIVVRDGERHVVLATELGHITIDLKTRLRCGCGGVGHLEALVSGANIPNRRFGSEYGIKPEDLNDDQWDEVLGDMAVGLRSISAAAPGRLIVMGGGVAFKQRARLPVLQQKVARLPSTFPVPTLRLAKHGEDSGLVGATYAAVQIAAT